MAKRYRSRREELTQLRCTLRAQGATFRHIAQLVAARYNINSRVAYRLAHGLTQQQVADQWNELYPSTDGEQPITHKHVSYWEAWPGPTGRAPSPEVLNRLARVYLCRAADLLDGEDHSGMDKATMAIQVPALPATPTATGQAEAGDVVSRVDEFIARSGTVLVTSEFNYQRLVRELIEWACRMKRRDILQWLSWAAASAAAAPVLDSLDDQERERTTLALMNPRRVDATVVDHIEAVLWRCMRQDDTLGPQAALDTTLAQRRLVRSLLAEAPEALKDRLLSLYANVSRFAGWLSFDLNNYAGASDYYETARTAAHEAHNTELGAFVLCNMSHLATWRGQPRIGIDHAVAAQGWAVQTDDPLLQAYAADVAARAYAMDRQGRPTQAAIEKAGRYLRSATPTRTTRSLVYFYNEGQLASTESVCYLNLGHPDRGAAAAAVAMQTIDSSFVRNLALTSLRLGICRLRSPRPDVDLAARAIGDAARLASHNRSVRLVERLLQGSNQLEPWKDTPAVRKVQDQLAVYRVA